MCHLGFGGQNDPQTKIQPFHFVVMLKLLENDPSFVLLAHQAPYFTHYNGKGGPF